MPKMLMVPCFGLLLMMVFVGCGDDDECPSCPQPAATPLGFTEGILVTIEDGRTLMSLEILGTGSGLLNLDSVRVGDSLVPRTDWGFTYELALTDLHYILQFQEDGVPVTYMYDPGDTATIKAWGDGRSSTCRLKILDYDLMAAHITTPAPDVDTIAPGAADTVFWNKVEDADYYACVIAYLIEWEASYRLSYYYTTDTSFIITGAMYHNLASRIEFYVNPFNGPDPRTGQTNWSGDLLGGVVYSSGQFDVTEIQVLQPTKSDRIALAEPVEILPKWSSEEIVANVYKKYGR